MSLESVVEAVRGRVVPEEPEIERLEAVVAELTERAEAAIETLPAEADTRLVGSTARDTWLSGDRDVDLFVRFSADLPREDLEAYGLEVGHAVLPDGHEEFAEHPYVKGTCRGFDVDCVPCYAVESATDIRSAVDRTPFHTAYLEGRIDPVTDDVRVAKALLRAVGAYGSDLRTRGFSGYLTELLVLEYGGFEGLLEAAAGWQPPVQLDPASHGRADFDDPLVVVDPTDPERNVAAVCSARNVARLVHHARGLLSEPSLERFEPAEPEPLTTEQVRTRLTARGTAPVAVRFDAPDIVDDQLYPQLEKSLAGVEGTLERGGFEPLRSAHFADGSAALLVECAVGQLPAIERHRGPPVGVRSHAKGFYDSYAGADATGPFLDEEGHYVVERKRENRTPGARLEATLFDVSLGTHVESALDDGYELLRGEAVATLAEEFGVELAAYFDPGV